MNIITRNIPNAVTCMNVTAGCLSVLFSVRGYAEGSAGAWGWACIFIAIAAVADFLDGFAARLLHAYSEMGKELDSICDMVSFGVAPAVLLFCTLHSAGAPAWVAWCVPLIAVCGALRLARFNVDTRQTTSFIGLPIPANAIFWIGYTALLREGTGFLADGAVAAAVILVESWLMVSPLRLFSLKFKTWGWKGNEARWLLIAGAVVCVFCMGVSGLMWLIVYYLLLSLLPFARRA